MKNPAHHISRRRFIGQMGCAALGTSGLISSLLNTRLMGQVAAATDPSDYKSLVCLFLLGGNDSYNMLPPRGNTYLYSGYAAARGDLALPVSQIDPLSPLDAGLPIGIHYRLPKLARIFNEDRNLAFVANVGTLLRPTTSCDLGKSGYLPVGAYSHSDQQEQWQTCFLNGRTAMGWGGKMVDSMYGGSVPWASNISIGGVNIWQTGDARNVGSSQPFSVTPGGLSLIDGPGSNNVAYEKLYRDAIDSMFGSALESQRPGVLERVFHRNVRRSNDQADKLNAIINPPIDPATGKPDYDPADKAVIDIFDDPELSDNPLAKDLLMAARFIALRDKFSFNEGPRRQTFFIGLGGWDHHDEVLENQKNLFKIVDDAVDAFYRALALKEVNALDKTTLFTASDFGRTLTSNGKGSDHGWGGNSFVLGGKVNGGRIYGAYPDLSPDALVKAKLDAGRLRVIPTTSVDQYFATLAKWMDVPQSEFPDIFPNLKAFIDAGEPADLGFMCNESSKS